MITIVCPEDCVIVVSWVDAISDDDWTTDTNLKPGRCRSLGFVVHRPTPKEPWLTLAADRHDDGSEDGPVCRLMTIPASSITNWYKLGKLTEV